MSGFSSCAKCGRDFAVVNSLQAEPDNSVVVTNPRINRDNDIDNEILRLRIKLQPSKRM